MSCLCHPEVLYIGTELIGCVYCLLWPLPLLLCLSTLYCKCCFKIVQFIFSCVLFYMQSKLLSWKNKCFNILLTPYCNISLYILHVMCNLISASSGKCSVEEECRCCVVALKMRTCLEDCASRPFTSLSLRQQRHALQRLELSESSL